MTFITTISVGDCVIVAADRATFHVNGSASTRSDQEVKKIRETPGGFITGNGIAELLEPVKDRFVSEDPKDLAAMIQIIESEQSEYLFRQDYSDLATKWVAQTSWKLSMAWRMDDRTSIIAASYDYTIRSVIAANVGVPFLTFPSDVTLDENAHVRLMLERGQLTSSDAPSTLAMLYHNVRLILDVVGLLRRRGRAISERIDFAIHTMESRLQFDDLEFLS
ncbi:Conserved hypothetical protein [Pseudomonas veronii 1YdBTEX2]|jgi:hypothetical protein|uniref:Phage protein n=2 Tax=Pseudomonas fluorescens group TaxID=136843 RepID=A0ABS0UHV6_9PSED|nr:MULTISPECIES: hypothetical protein [Pseudomonas]SBW85003.1 Conserved hypothetical protein [Pseudomonas veronii 1YdBTEX2]MBI6565173.1 hypothetical protein [Pseudomonas synxantha]MBI6579887.1 hypothetical protein [Pseudomonas synxantha]MBI6646701.1 hypothetical protein [Pseudomonas synxantha]MBJ2213320.1 hypothetical protein [Pseudomonas carnis]